MHPECKFYRSMPELNLHLEAFPSLRFVLTTLQRVNLKGGEIEVAIRSMHNGGEKMSLIKARQA